MSFRIKNWEKFQHFKDRRPPWIKLYREILDDYDIAMISDRSFRVLINLWLLASEDKTGRGELPHVDAIAHRLRTKKEYIIKALEECVAFLVQDDIIPSSPSHQSVTTETETETETEKRQSKSHNAHARVNKNTNRKNAKSLPDDWQPNEKHQELASDNNIDIVVEEEKFKDYAAANGKTYKDWDAAFRNWLRNASNFSQNGRQSNLRGFNAGPMTAQEARIRRNEEIFKRLEKGEL